MGMIKLGAVRQELVGLLGRALTSSRGRIILLFAVVVMVGTIVIERNLVEN